MRTRDGQNVAAGSTVWFSRYVLGEAGLITIRERGTVLEDGTVLAMGESRVVPLSDCDLAETVVSPESPARSRFNGHITPTN